MVDQPKGGALEPVAGAISRDEVLEDPEPKDGYPVPVTLGLLERGRNRFDIVCAACHAVGGTGETPVADHMKLRRPPSLLEPRIARMKPAELHRIIKLGYALMPSYSAQLSSSDQWAVVAYVKALQLSRSVPILALPASLRQEAGEALQ